MTQTILTNYQKHLYFENNPNSKEYKLDKCNKILALIARLKDRNQTIIDFCIEFYGETSDNCIKCSVENKKTILQNRKTILRLKMYFNKCLLQITSFN